MYEDRRQNYDPEIHEECLVHHVLPLADYSIAIHTTRGTN